MYVDLTMTEELCYSSGVFVANGSSILSKAKAKECEILMRVGRNTISGAFMAANKTLYCEPIVLFL